MQGGRRIRASRLSAAALFSIAAVALPANDVISSPNEQEREEKRGGRKDDRDRPRVLPLSLCAPGRQTFSTDVDNPFFPLPEGQQWVLVGNEGTDDIGLQITVLEGTETFYEGTFDVETVRVEETEWQDDDGDGEIDDGEFVIEISTNYFAQTEDGTVCYFGEDVDIFSEDSEEISHEGAWRADDEGNAPGIFMPEDPEVGMTFQQEVAPGVAEDRATIVAEDKPVRTPARTFTNTIITSEFNPLDGGTGTKAYAKRVGLIQDDELRLLRY
jgi:hypothetical protein